MAEAVSVSCIRQCNGRNIADAEGRRFVVRVRDAAAHVLDDDVLAELPYRLEPSLGLVGLPVRRQGPDHFLLLVPILGHHHSKQEPLAPGVEMRRLSAIAG